MSDPRTGFELSGGAVWTTLAEEAEYIDAVLALGSRIKARAGWNSAGGRPLRVFEVAMPHAAAGGGRPTVMFVAQQHGPEVAGREALLILLREWATSTDASVVDYLSRARIVCIPTANPDGLPTPALPNGTRGNADGVDTNRDHCAVVSPEAQLIQRMITEYSPDVVIDSHEKAGTAGTYFDYLRGVHPMIHPAIESLSLQLENELIAMASSYPGWAGKQFALAPEPNPTLARVAGLRNSLSILFESDGLDPTPRVDRVELQKRSFELVRDFHGRRMNECRAACSAGRIRGILRAADAARPYDWWTAWSATTPRAYFVTDSQHSANAHVFEAFGLAGTAVAGGINVGIDDVFPLLPTLFDSRSYSAAFSATALAGTPGVVPRLINLPRTGWVPCTVHALINGAWHP